MTSEPPNPPRGSSLVSALRNLDGLVATLNVAFVAAAFMFAVLSLVWAVNDRSELELICAFALFVAGGALTRFVEVDGE